jgi:hypothetical protein
VDLETIEAIRGLKYRYLRSLDLKIWDEFEDTLCEDVVANYGSPSGGQPLNFTSRAAVVEYMRESLPASIATVHVASHPEITVDGDTASGSWCLEDTVLASEFGVMIRGAAYYEDTYRREDGVWRIASTGYRRMYETLTNYGDDKNFTVTALAGHSLENRQS